MRKQLLVLAIFLGAFGAKSQNIDWLKNMEGLKNCEGKAIAIDHSGNVYTTGYFDSIMDFDPGVGTYTIPTNGSHEAFISKLDANGNFVWAKTIGDNGYAEGDAIKIDGSGNIITTGFFYGTVDFDPNSGTNILSSNSGDMFVSKLDANGNFIWAKNIGGTGFVAGTSLSIDNLNNILITGQFTGSADFDPGINTYQVTSTNPNGNSDIFVTKLDISGNFLWAHGFGLDGLHQGTSIATDILGNVFTTGYYHGSVDFDPSVNSYVLNSPSHDNAYILKLSSAGNFMWAKQFGDSTNHCYGFGITVDHSGNVYTTGSFSGSKDFDPDNGIYSLTSNVLSDTYISKLDGSGNFIWAKNMGAASGSGCSICIDKLGNVYISGVYRGSSDIDSGPGIYNLNSGTSFYNGITFISKSDSNGVVLSAKLFGSIDGSQGSAIALDSAANVFVTGFFQGNGTQVDFDPGPLTYTLNSTDRNSNFIVKLSPMISSGLEDIKNNKTNFIAIYPNPTSDFITINSQKTITKIELYNALGQLVFQNNNTSEKINISFLTDGIYYVKVFFENSVSISKFVKQTN